MQIPKIKLKWRKEWTPLAIAGGAAFTVGFGVGFVTGKTRKKTIEVQDVDIDDDVMTVHGIRPEAIVLDKAVLVPMAEDTAEEPEEREEIKTNIFSRDDDEWDYDKEVANRSPAEPYIIHEDEFYEKKEDDLEQSTLTYFEGDDILVDEADVPIYNRHVVVGTKNLRFGHGSLDPNKVYIRNEKLEHEYEVIRHSGHYVVEILGEEIDAEYAQKDLKHSTPKFRPE